MKYQTNFKPSIRRQEHEIMRDEAAAANHMNSLLTPKHTVYITSKPWASLTASSQFPTGDADIAVTVKDAIGCITTVPEEVLQVSVTNGWVTLRGNLDSWAQRETVERIALHSLGVRGVVNSITVGKRPFLFL